MVTKLKWMALEKTPDPKSLCHPQTTKETISAYVGIFAVR